jgi:hypothetical protein
MFHPDNNGRELVLPNRIKLRSLRDQYMRDLDAVSYDEVRDKFLQELKSKRGLDEAKDSPGRSGSRERGAGIWNKAFARSGRMYRSSIILLAEFFAVAPEELIVTPGPDDSPQTEEVKTMPADIPLEPAMESLVAYSQRSPSLDIQTRNLCQQLSESFQRHYQKPISEIIGRGQPADVARLREAILQLTRVEPSVQTLILRISKMSAPAERVPSRAYNPVFNRDHNQVFTVQGDLQSLTGPIFNNQNTFNIGSGKKDGNGSSSS